MGPATSPEKERGFCNQVMDSYLQTISSDWYRQRIAGALIFVVTAFLILLVRLYYLQIIDGPELRRLSEENWFRLQSLPPMRGLIFDRNGVLLVDNRPRFDVSIVSREAEDAEQMAQELAKLLGVSAEGYLTKLAEARGQPSFKPVLLERDIDRDALAVIEAHKLDLPGIVVNVVPTRHYVEGERASHLIGYLSEISSRELQSGAFADNRAGDFIGKFGVEKAFESDFHGQRGRQHVEVNALGQITKVLKTEGALPGSNVYLTLDIGLQRTAESLLTGKVGTALAMDPSNGQILAMAVSPRFDPNAFVEGMTPDAWKELVTNEFRPMENKAIQGQYPPGSTYKIVAAIAGLEEGVIAQHTRLFCPGFYKYGDRTFRCWKRRGHGFMDVTDALTQSCDVFFYQVGEKLGIDRLARYATACGLGGSTGIDLDKEARGLVPTSSWKLTRIGVPWQRGETLSVVIGQGFNLATPIQMLGLISAVANGGTLYKPMVVSRIESPDGSSIQQQMSKAVGRLPASEKTLRIIKRGLTDAVNKPTGTGWGVRIADVVMAGKTGTAQVVRMADDDEEKPSESQEMRHRDHGWFVAFAPVDSASIAVAVLVEHGGHGSTSAAPIAGDMIKTYLGVSQPSHNENPQMAERRRLHD